MDVKRIEEIINPYCAGTQKKDIAKAIHTEHQKEIDEKNEAFDLIWGESIQIKRDYIKRSEIQPKIKEAILFIRQNMFLPENDNLEKVTEIICGKTVAEGMK